MVTAFRDGLLDQKYSKASIWPSLSRIVDMLARGLRADFAGGRAEW